MNRIELAGVDGSNPLGFLAALGLLRVLRDARLSFADDGSFRAFVDFEKTESDLVKRIADDAKSAAAPDAPWYFTYTKDATKKKGAQEVADLKPPPEAFKAFLASCVDAWCKGADEKAAYAAAYGTDVALDGNGKTKPTAFHFTAANQTFLGIVETIRASLTQEWIQQSLLHGHEEKPGSNLRWDPRADRNWALMAEDPNREGTSVDAPLEWLAFRGLPLLPSFPRGAWIVTTAVVGRGDEMTFTWPLWSVPASLHTVRALVQLDWGTGGRGHAARGVFATCRSAIRRTSQGFGNFGPSLVGTP